MSRVYHPWWEWECYAAGFYGRTAPAGITDPRASYAEFLSNQDRFKAALERVVSEWANSCSHFLGNPNINRVAWLGQASMCVDSGVPSRFRSGFYLLSDEQQRVANSIAQNSLTEWIISNDSSARPKREVANGRLRETSNCSVARVRAYERFWMERGYPDGIPDTSPVELEGLGLAPSWRVVACALLKNDVQLLGLGFVARKSDWYGALKRIELRGRGRHEIETSQMQFEF